LWQWKWSCAILLLLCKDVQVYVLVSGLMCFV
jgi:hypothetical protein